MGDLTTEILETCGGMAVGIHTVVVSNEQRGIPNTYLMLAEQFGMSRSSIHRIVRPMIERGFIQVKESGGGRNKKTVLIPVNRPASRTVSPETVSDTVSQTVSETVLQTVPETVSNPPHTPPAVAVDKNLTPTTAPKPPRRDFQVLTDFKPTYANQLGELWPKLQQSFQRLDPDLTEGALLAMLAEVEQDIGPLTAGQVEQGVGLTFRAVNKKLDDAKNGGKPVKTIRGLTRHLMTERLREAAAAT